MNHFCRDDNGSSMIEFTVAIAMVMLIIAALPQAGLALWTIVGLQHGVEVAARCASVSDAAFSGELPLDHSTPCYPFPVHGNIVDNAPTVTAFAASNSWGLSPPASTFSVMLSPCDGKHNGNLVTASYLFMKSITLTAQSCVPRTPLAAS